MHSAAALVTVGTFESHPTLSCSALLLPAPARQGDRGGAESSRAHPRQMRATTSDVLPTHQPSHPVRHPPSQLTTTSTSAPRGSPSCIFPAHTLASARRYGEPNPRRCHGQVSSPNACGHYHGTRILTATYSGTGYSKLGMPTTTHVFLETS